MRAALVSVDYADLLAVTLPYNRHHFDSVLVVTSPTDTKTADVALANGAIVYRTDAFYRNGAAFNKWLAFEEGLDFYGRHGWLCLMDADVLWPREAPLPPLQQGFLYGALRYMMTDVHLPIPPEDQWAQFPIHRNVNEWAGYTQVFHTDDPVLGRPPWHETDWKHAGGADSFFQAKWHPSRRVRFPWNVLHLGIAGQNWYGRATEYLDGTRPQDYAQKREMVARIWRERKQRGNGPDRFAGEKIR